MDWGEFILWCLEVSLFILRGEAMPKSHIEKIVYEIYSKIEQERMNEENVKILLRFFGWTLYKESDGLSISHISWGYRKPIFRLGLDRWLNYFQSKTRGK